MSRLLLVVAIAFAGCGDVTPPIRSEMQADGGCWQVQECTAADGELANIAGVCPSMVNGHQCAARSPEGLSTCWGTAGKTTIYFASSCNECEVLSHCGGESGP